MNFFLLLLATVGSTCVNVVGEVEGGSHERELLLSHYAD